MKTCSITMLCIAVIIALVIGWAIGRWQYKTDEYYADYVCPSTIVRLGTAFASPPSGVTRRQIITCIFNYMKPKIMMLITTLGLTDQVCDSISLGKDKINDFVNENIDGVMIKIFDTLGITLPIGNLKNLVKNVVTEELNNFIMNNHKKLSTGLNCPLPPAPEDEWA